jgi:hypothetical protein
MKGIVLSVALCLMIAACAPWVPLNQNPNRIRSPERLAFEACLQSFQQDESRCKNEKQALLRQQEWEMMTPNY